MHPPDRLTLETIDRWLRYRVWHSRTPGAQVAIGLGGKLIFSHAYGSADLERDVALRTDHRFRIASHSKTFTATAILQLVDQGRLGLEDAVGTVVPELAEAAIAQVRVRELLEHTSGLVRDGRDADYWQGQGDFPGRDEVLAMARTPLKAEPGARFAYSNVGYAVLGLVIESVTGQSYAEALRQLIIEPLGLIRTGPSYRADEAADYATGYSGLLASRRRHPIASVDTRAFDPATGFGSTAEELVSYFGAHAFGDERLLTDRTKRLMQRRANLVDGRAPSGAWYGWGMGGEAFDEHATTGHSGGYPGHVTRTLLDPEDGLIITVLTNAIDGPASSLAAGVLAIVDAARRDGDEPEPAESPIFGRWRNLWNATDIGVVGAKVRSIDLAGWTPLKAGDELAPDADGYRIVEGDGYGYVGERVALQTDGTLRYGGMTLFRFDQLPGSAEAPRP